MLRCWEYKDEFALKDSQAGVGDRLINKYRREKAAIKKGGACPGLPWTALVIPVVAA